MRISWWVPGTGWQPLARQRRARWRCWSADEGDPVITVAPVELTDAALAAEVADGLALRSRTRLRRPPPAPQHDLLDADRGAPDRRRAASGFRATLVLLAAQFGNPRDERVVPAAVAIELTHLATLYHDDVMDEADVRRGTPSANSRWDNSVAILTGDLPVRPRLADPGRPRSRGGQDPGRDVQPAGRPARSPRPSGRVPGAGSRSTLHGRVTEKTASLIATSGRFGADVLRRTRRSRAARIARPARRSASPSSSPTTSSTSRAIRAQSGKTPGTDLREGVRTLPVLHALRSAGPGRRAAGGAAQSGDLTDRRRTPRR